MSDNPAKDHQLDTKEWFLIDPLDFISEERLRELVQISKDGYSNSAVCTAVRDAVYAVRHSIVIQPTVRRQK